MNDLDQTRAKLLGDLIRDARLRAGRSIADCAQILTISEERFIQAEAGEYTPALPDLEVLAMYLNVPMAYFWGNASPEIPQQTDYESFAKIRQRIIGVLLRRARLQSKHSVEEVAEHLGTTVEQVNNYESGASAVPLFELEKLGKYFGVNMDYFSDEARGPLAQHESWQKMQRRFNDLPPDIRQFVVEPINLSYVQIAMHLSELDVKRLRNIAEGLLDITF
ncbi:MAG: helix-turn-helix transcriptional regulator [Candidatus Promineifilaceae bacterium]